MEPNMKTTTLPPWNQARINAVLAWADATAMGASDAEIDRARRAYEAAASIKLMRQRRANHVRNLCR
jgi:hypothetical protein